MLSFFCPYCWTRVSDDDSVCPQCGGNIRVAEARPFAEKLRAALHHSEPQTRVRAAWIPVDPRLQEQPFAKFPQHREEVRSDGLRYITIRL